MAAMNDMSKEMFKNHLQAMRAGASQATAISELSLWISDNTFIHGKPYSYKNHEYQERILNSTAREINTRKCSQVGLSEMSVRKALALCGMIKNFTVIYTLPTATFASTLSKTRISPVISDSPYLKSLVTETDNMEVKQLGNSFLYCKGSASSNAPISIPADMLIHDEIDFSDPLTISQYQSRLTHSTYKMKNRLSTPTIPGKGIDYHFQNSKRFFNFVKCNHCGEQFIPQYYEHVRIPGFSGDLMSVTKRNIHSINYSEAEVFCPKCGKTPSLQPQHREWVCENPSENHIAEGFQVSPFDAPNIITPGYLVEASTAYQNISEFHNFNLGLPYFSQESVLSPAEIEGTILPSDYPGSASYVMGIDLGKMCHVVVASCSYDGAMQVVHLEEVPLQLLKERYKALRAQYRVRISVIDSLPYTDTVLAIQALDQNCWASVYTNTRGSELFTIKKREEDDERGLQQLRQINVSRDRTFDALMAFIRSGQFSKLSCEHDKDFVTHCTDMRRVKDWNLRSQQIEFKWVKSETGEDHFWFALSYAFLAKHIVGTASGGGMALPLMSTFRVRQTY
jgi:hypothetical protein